MKKMTLWIIGGFITGALISPVVGMAIGSTRSLILKMAPNDTILALANKIDQESGRNDDQEQKINELNDIKNQQNSEMDSLKKNQEIASCQKKKEDCEKKIYELENGEIQINNISGTWKGNRTEMIIKLKNIIDSWEKNKKESADHKEVFQDNIDNAEKEIKKIEEIMANETIIKGTLLAGECKDYQNPCE